jgi:hypothetical protein
VEEFLTCGLWPVGEQFGFPVETKVSPLSKVLVPMPQITATIGEWGSEAQFMASIEDAANLLVGKYNTVEHTAYQGFRHRRLNHIFELAGILCPSQPEPIVWKHKWLLRVQL